MKKLVVSITPLTETDDATESARSEPARDQHEAGSMKVEAILSDADAERILATVASCRVASPDKQLVAHLVEQELALAGPHAQDLWHRIVSDVERKLITQVYADCDGVKTRAAARLGIDRNTLHKKLRQYDLILDEGDAAEAPVEAS